MYCIIDDLKVEFVFILDKPYVKKCSTKTFNNWVLYFNNYEEKSGHDEVCFILGGIISNP